MSWTWLVPFLQSSAAALAAVLVLGYAYVTHHHGKWKALGVPHTPPTPLFGHLGDTIRNRAPLIDAVESLYRRFGGQRYFGIYEARRPALVVRDPALVHAVLVKDFDAFRDRIADDVSFKHDGLFRHLLNLRGGRWKAVRTELTPAFTGAKLRAMMPDVYRCTEMLLEDLDAQSTANDDGRHGTRAGRRGGLERPPTGSSVFSPFEMYLWSGPCDFAI